MIPNSYKIVCRCVEEGCEYGLNKALEYVDENDFDKLLDKHRLLELIEEAVMLEICENFRFEEIDGKI